MSENRRVILIVLDSLGAGAMPDAADYGDQGASTINHIVERMPSINIPNLNKLGFGKIQGIKTQGSTGETARDPAMAGVGETGRGPAMAGVGETGRDLAIAGIGETGRGPAITGVGETGRGPAMAGIGENVNNGNIFEKNMKISNNMEILGAYGRAAEKSAGKDTITGHWEIAGLVTEAPFQTFTDTGFPQEFIEAFEKRIGIGVLGNYSASGTEIIEKLGPEHKETGKPIVYTSADSVFQIAANMAVIPLERLYEMCEIAREMLQGELLVGRVIARPFVEENGVYTRTSDRKDYAVSPPAPTVLDYIRDSGKEVMAIGKIEDIFNGVGITWSVHTSGNDDGIDKTLDVMKTMEKSGLIFTNLVDFDSKYGHRRDVKGYGRAIENFDKRLPEIMSAMKPEDILILCADHGNDPAYSGWNHTREYVPVMVYGQNIIPDVDLHTLNSFADIGATVCDYLNVEWDCDGKSFLDRIMAYSKT